MHLRAPSLAWGFWLLILLLGCLSLPGCGGCGGDPDELAEEQAEEEAEKEKDAQKSKPKPPFEPARLYIQPNLPSEDRILSVKPGHWTMATAEMKANNFHYTGELHVTAADRSGSPAVVESTPYSLATIRSAPLPKGQQKFLEFAAFVPRDVTGPRLISELRAVRGGITEVYSDPLQQMPPYQYYLLILSAQPESFRALSRSPTRLDSIRAPGDEEDLIHYKVVAPPVQQRVPLPTNALAWSSIAYILWDDVDPALFDVDQRQALVDWLHWGGQLIISGPGTLDKLKGSFLDPSSEASLLPARAGESIKLTPEQVAAMGSEWNTFGKDNLNGRTLVVARDWSVVKLNKHPAAQFVVNTQEQVVERQIGRGRIAVTSFRLGQSSLLNWPSFDCFLNAVLLRRPPRAFVSVPEKIDSVAMRWWGEEGPSQTHLMDPRLTTTLRYFSRDVGDKGEFVVDGGLADVAPTPAMTPDGTQSVDISLDDESLETDVPSAKGSGLGGWNDFQGAASAARAALSEAAGIKIPNATFVVFVLAVYLAVLVPLNWGIFRVVGRIELAWIAAPLIAIAGAMSVIKLAQLDIGFARSQTEISLLEAHADYPRAHLTRYTALYASLGTEYDLVFEDKNALAMPFPADANFEWLRGEDVDRVEYRRDETGARLAGFTVKSNSTGMVHSEQMYDLGGVFTYTDKGGRQEVYNRTKYAIYNAGVIRRASASRLQVAWIGDLQPNVGAKASFTAAPSRFPLLAQWNLSTSAEVDRPLQRLLNLAQRAEQLEIGEVRLLGIIREPLSGLTVEPEPSQSERSPTLVVAHLKQTRLVNHPPQPDKNSRAALVGEESAEDE
ncbi:MAG: hypothetical protein WD894_23050 [Pirellulales bacterium]